MLGSRQGGASNRYLPQSLQLYCLRCDDKGEKSVMKEVECTEARVDGEMATIIEDGLA